MTGRPIQEHAYVRRSFDDVCRLFAQEAVRVLQPATEAAVREAGSVVADLHVELGGLEIGKRVVIDLGELVRDGDDMARLGLRWRATRQAALFPSLQADLVVSRLTRGPEPLTQISLVGHYTPPLGMLGRVGDAIVGRRIAQASLRHFVGEVARRVERELSPLGVGRYLGETG